MAKQIPIVNTSTDTFSVWVTRTNDVINTVNTEILTANSNANGATTTGNTFLVGVFGSNTVAVANNIRGGNCQATSTLVISSNVSVTGNQIAVGANVIMNTSSFSVGGIAILPTTSKVSANTSGSSTQVIDEFPLTAYSGCDYTLVIKDATALSNAYQISKVVLVHNSLSVYSTEYAVMHTNTSLGTFSSDKNVSNAALYFTPLVANCQITGVKVITDKI